MDINGSHLSYHVSYRNTGIMGYLYRLDDGARGLAETQLPEPVAFWQELQAPDLV